MVLHNPINYFERETEMKDMCSRAARISIHIIGFTLTPSSSSSLAPIHNHGFSDHSLFWQTPFSLSVTKHMVDIMRSECVQEMKRIHHYAVSVG